MAEPDVGDSTTWESVLRKMLPAGAPLPDEDQLDYSISVQYHDPPVPKTDPVDIHDSISDVNSNSTTPVIPVISPVIRKFSRARNSNLNYCYSSSSRRSSASVSKTTRLDDLDSGHLVRRVKTATFDTESEVSSPRSSVADRTEFSSPTTVVVAASSTRSEEEEEKGRKRRGICTRCGNGKNRLMMKEREVCIVCDARYCSKCVVKAMGSMPEGRKCLSCIGKPIDEAKRWSLGKCSRILRKACSPLEVKQIMKAERECWANQIRPEQLVVNGRQLKQEELVQVLGCSIPPKKLKPGRYWYDKDSGLWGKEGEKPDRIISSKLNVGGKLRLDASNGNAKVYINCREITKIELRVLKLAKVQCPRNTHFWVYDDGSYEEEGQNNIKGNIWGKASTRFICSLFSLPVPGNLYGHEDPTTFSGRLVPEYLEKGRVQKLLLFGLEGSGTSTIFKQVKFLYGNKFTAEELQNIKLTIQSNLYRYLSILLEGREHFEEEALMEKKTTGLDGEESAPGERGIDGSRQCIFSTNQRFKHFSDWFLDIMAMGDLDEFFPAATREYAPVIDEVWKDPAIQETYKRRQELHFLPDVAKYFLDRAIEVSSNEYQPSEKDVVFAEGVTPSNGLAFVEFSFDDHYPMSEIYNKEFECRPPVTKYQLISINSKGGLNDGSKWLEMFEDVKAVVFCVSLSDYDQVWVHSTGQVENKMLTSRDLFESVVRHRCFVDTPFVLLLNKYDAFEDKINQVPLRACEWFCDFSPLKPHQNSQFLAQQAYYYVAVKFKELYYSITRRKLFVCQTQARERMSVDEAFKYVREVLKWDEEKNGNMYGISLDDNSFYSSEMSSSPYISKQE